MSRILDALDGVHRIRDGQFTARCPAHEDRSPSLFITITDDGVTLLRCFAGCSFYEIVNAVGLRVSDLFPEKTGFRRATRPKYQARDLLLTLEHEIQVVFLAATAIVAGRNLTKRDHERLLEAIRRISIIRMEIRT